MKYNSSNLYVNQRLVLKMNWLGSSLSAHRKSTRTCFPKNLRGKPPLFVCIYLLHGSEARVQQLHYEVRSNNLKSKSSSNLSTFERAEKFSPRKPILSPISPQPAKLPKTFFKPLSAVVSPQHPNEPHISQIALPWNFHSDPCFYMYIQPRALQYYY